MPRRWTPSFRHSPSRAIPSGLREPRNTMLVCLRGTVGEDLELKQFQPQDAAALFAAVEQNRHHLRQWLPWVDATRSVDDIRQFVSRVAVQLDEGLGPNFGIWRNGNSRARSDAILSIRPIGLAAWGIGSPPDIRVRGLSPAVAGTCWTICLTRRTYTASRSAARPGIREAAPSLEGWAFGAKGYCRKRSG